MRRRRVISLVMTLLRISLNSSSVTEATLFSMIFYLAILIQNFLDQGRVVVFFHDRNSHVINGEEDILDRIIFIFPVDFLRISCLRKWSCCIQTEFATLTKRISLLSRRVSYKQKFSDRRLQARSFVAADLPALRECGVSLRPFGEYHRFSAV